MTAVPVLLLTGYLGAGKTTVLNHLLGLPEVAAQHPALIINEFGTLGVDAQRVRPGAYSVFEINKGSLFCICTKTSFIDALQRIAALGTAGLLVIEATGVSETRDIEGFLDAPGLAGRFAVQANLGVVDTTAFTKVAAFLKAAVSQVVAADGLILNKADLAGAHETATVQRVLGELNPAAPQTVAAFGQVPWSFIASLRHRRVAETAMAAAPEGLCALSVRNEAMADHAAFVGVVRDLGDRLLRLKGHVRFADGVRFVELAGGRYTEGPPLGDAQGTAFTAIAWSVPRPELQAAFAAALVRDPQAS